MMSLRQIIEERVRRVLCGPLTKEELVSITRAYVKDMQRRYMKTKQEEEEVQS